MTSADAFLLFQAEHAFGLDRSARVGVAVSGGSDSLATLHLLAKFWDLQAVTINHRLRPEAAEEAAFVANACAAIGVPHDTVIWRHGSVTGNLQDAARRARYDLLVRWAKKHKLTHIALGHTLDDQAETVLMRIARQAGVDGLGGMAARRVVDGITFARPFLGCTREDLRGFLRAEGIGWIDDPSNTDLRFDRVKARQALQELRPLGITAEALSQVAHNMQMARHALAHYDAEAFQKLGQQDRGDLLFEARAFHRLHPETRRRLLVAALRWVSGADYAPRSDAVIRLEIGLRQGKSHTLHGCRVISAKGTVRFAREARAVREAACSTRQIWDGRWKLRGPHSKSLTVSALGADGLKLCPDAKATGLPRASLLASPAIWHNNKLIAAPLAQLGDKWRAELAQKRDDFISFLLSH